MKKENQVILRNKRKHFKMFGFIRCYKDNEQHKNDEVSKKQSGPGELHFSIYSARCFFVLLFKLLSWSKYSLLSQERAKNRAILS